ncbi:holdfast anchor protein HfaD [Brevundimonas sp. AJA228-03]|uniref:holdfast anchor protein HfaD n=1 Tax=Brevundimonas sp. AJA228-03 TaxID=2752515 RepID=UPI001AE0C4FD|nr:holdfast anchor protein HfaD [Brevundimonas sp. AJA228-03]QTN20620.1 holdfast anchor protein HfaD [Brevundimonas sp. AJA228-03]
MARPAPIRTAGTIAATALYVAAATSAFGQTRDGVIVLNNQLQLGDVIAGQTLNVEGASDEVGADTAAQGNSLSGTAQDRDLQLTSTQTSSGDVRSTTTLNLDGDLEGPVNATTQSRGNYLAAASYGGDIAIEATQEVGPTEVTAASSLNGPSVRMLGGASVGVTAIANTTSMAASASHVSGIVIQRSEAGVRAENFAETRYIPATAEFISQSVANTTALNSGLASSQDLTIRQRSAGDAVTASTSANAANAWDLAGRARATANQTLLYNDGGSVVATTDQSNLSQVRASATVTSYDWGAAAAVAAGTGNEVVAGNNDVYLEIDSSQVNSGGVEVSADFAGTNGYDAYVSADAIGNSVTGYVCATCQGNLIATNAQTNSGPVSATATTTVSGTGRAIASSASAVGNTATFYVSRPGS